MSEFADAIKALRADKGMTQEELALVWDVPLKTYQSWEQGNRIPAIWLRPWIIEQIKKLPKKQ
jgi:DNA-binding transcriptional regulator YiaG